MDKHAAQKMIQDTLERSFDKGRFFYFLKNMLNHVEENSSAIYRGNHLPEAYKSSIDSLERLGKYNDEEDNEIDLLVVQLKKDTSLERARALQRNFASWHLKGGTGGNLKDAALTAYVSPSQKDWRFSFVKMDYKFVQSDNGRTRVKEEFTPARRYSFLVGENENSHTAKSQLLPLLENDDKKPTLGEIEDKFSIETVTKEFFESYRDLFLRATEFLDKIVESDAQIKEDFLKKNVNTVDFSKKLLGQIVFLYFLQKKGWFGVERDSNWGTGSKGFIRDLFNQKNKTYKNFFNDILEPLFYEALASERTSDFYAYLNCKIPFLNGGLFDPIGNYDWVHTDILLPNDLFSNKKQTSQGDIGTGIFDIFDRYNFTVKEDEPLEKEVAVDPEMLGKVFENLLEVKDRKSKGTFYTPREIVHYMCRQSLTHYLVTELKGEVNKEDIEKLIQFGETVVEHDSRVARSGKETDRYSYKLPIRLIENATGLDRALANIRICDPAVGSGAFLLGMMSEIIRIRNTLSSYLGGCSKRTSCDFKRSAIQDSLYGVDIDSGAIEICKLRLWLSLVVDEDDISHIHPLPNLDYKIVQGNSLLGVKKDLYNLKFFNELEEIKPKYFYEVNIKRKKNFKDKIDSLIEQISDGKKDFDFEVYFSEIFHKGKGFDVVLTNPPYIGESGHKEIFREIKKGALAKFYQGKMDIFYFFFHLALNIGKQNSKISFITTNYYLTATGAKKLRLDFKKRCKFKSLVNFNELSIFESARGQHNIITLIENGSNAKAECEIVNTKRKGMANQQILEELLGFRDAETDYFNLLNKDLYDGDNLYIRLSNICSEEESSFKNILAKIKDKSVLLGDICNIRQGVVSGCDKASIKILNILNARHDIQRNDAIFVFDLNNERDRQAIKKFSKDERKLLRPFYKNSDIAKFWCKLEPSKLLLYYHKELSKREYPNIYQHLKNFQKILNLRLETYGENYHWTALHRPREERVFTSPKIVVPYRSKINSFAYNKIEWFCRSDSYCIVQNDKDLSLKYILALLNSKLYFFWLYFKGKRKGEILEMFHQPLTEIPIKHISKNKQEPFISTVDKILTITSSYKINNNFEIQAKIQKHVQELDGMVFKLNELTPSEIAQVENHFNQSSFYLNN
jgi:hypothetical protein